MVLPQPTVSLVVLKMNKNIIFISIQLCTGLTAPKALDPLPLDKDFPG
jgi:hypothetical protein